jgi:PD-(D/E)XK endonuclease
MRDTTSIGNVTEGQVLGALLRHGYTVLVPFGAQAGFDLVLYQGGIFSRVQCKTGRLKNGAINFRLYSVTLDSTTKRYRTKPYKDAVDFYGVYCPDTKQTYLVPTTALSTWQADLRLEAPKNNQRKGVLWAKDYQL